MLNFERIELLGFKSFADKVRIELLDGITAIVGPNGCGKSNVADAIKWVLGEQSAKSMRGTSMQDVIFNGTQSRKSLSYCEVSLYFNNSEKIFPSLDYTEVVMTRKDLFEILDCAYSLGFSIGLISNGKLINDEFLQKIKKKVLLRQYL